MINSINRKIIDVSRHNVVPIASVKQMDDVLLCLTLVKNGLPFDVTGQTLSLRCKKSNKETEELSDPKKIKIDKNNIDIEIRNSAFNIEGELRLELNISDNKGAMTTATFFIMVMKKELDDNSVENSAQYDALAGLIKQYDELIKGDTNAEVIAARTDINNKVYSTLKDRIDDYNTYISDEKSYNVLTSPYALTSNKNADYVHIMIGMDSLSNGAGGSCWSYMFRNRILGELGNAGLGYVGIQNDNIINTGGSWGVSGGVDVRGNATYEKYSFDRKGEIMSSGGSISLNFTNFDVSSAYIIYLKHPNGGTFKARFNSATIEYTDIDTHSATYDLGVTEISGNDKNSNGRIVMNNFSDAETVIFGVFLKSGKEGAIVSVIGKGGDWLKDHANLDSDFRKKWIDILKPDILLFNGGTNDERDVTPSEFKTLFTKYVDDFRNKDTQVTIITPNYMERWDYMVDYEKIFDEYCINNNCSMVKHYKILGEYQDAMDRGWMLDGCHPNKTGNKKLCDFWLNRFGIPTIGKISDLKKTWGDTGVAKEYYKELSIKNVEISADDTGYSNLYTLGLLNAYTVGTIKLEVTAQNGLATLVKEFYLSVTNGTTVINQITKMGTPTTVEKYRYNNNLKDTFNFTLKAEIVDNKLVISISKSAVTTTGVNQKLFIMVKGSVSSAYVGTTGDLVFEN